MSREDAHKLLGGYATGTLTDAEQRALFQAALQDQDLFDALAREQALRDLLSDPAARAQVLAAVNEVPVAWYRKLFRPLPMTAMVGALTALLVVGVWQAGRPVRPTRIAKLELPPARSVDVVAPELPAAPEVKRQAPDISRSLSIPGVPAVAPPAPPLSAAMDKEKAITNNGALLDRLKKADNASSQDLRAEATPSAAPTGKNTLRGTVTDPAGAPVRSANVDVKDLSNGQVVHARTNELGEFITPELAPSPYEISAFAPGFRPATVSRLLPQSEPSDPVKLKLEVGSVADAVQVTAGAVAGGGGGGGGRGGGRGPAIGNSAGQSQQQSGQQRFQQLQQLSPYSQEQFRAATPQTVHTLYRLGNNGELTPVAEDEAIARSTRLRLRIIPVQDATVRLTDSTGRNIATRQVKAAQPQDFDLPPYNDAGTVELNVQFSGPVVPAGGGLGGARKNAAAPATAPAEEASPVTPPFTIKLNIR